MVQAEPLRLPPFEQVQEELARRFLRQFIKQAWNVIEPGTRYVPGWHIDAICEHLEAVALGFKNDAIDRGLIKGIHKLGSIRRLIINIPPRHMKSLSVSVMLPAWLWIDLPWLRFLFTSYAENLSVRDSVKCRRLIQSPWYQSRWGNRYALAGDQNAKTRFDNNKTGVRLASSVDGLATGEGGDCIVVDDPHNVKDAFALSEAGLNNVQSWWDEVMPTRLNDPKTGVRIIIMQRCHERDLTGHILSKEHNYTHLCLPARFERDHKYVYTKDPRKNDGEPLWKGKYDEPQLKELEQDMSSYAVAGQLQQRPAPREGGLIKRSWFKIIKAEQKPFIEEYESYGRWWDMAATKKQGSNDPDFTAGCKGGLIGKRFIIENIIDLRESPGSVQTTIKQTATLDGEDTPIFMEQEPGSAGKTVIHHYATEVLTGHIFKGIPSTGSKEAYVEVFATAAEHGLVELVAGPWTEKFLDEAEVFPRGKHDDKVESAAKLYCRLTQRPRARARFVGGEQPTSQGTDKEDVTVIEAAPANQGEEDMDFEAIAEVNARRIYGDAVVDNWNKERD
jgi:predicted phage terminase large subunit-like protein